MVIFLLTRYGGVVVVGGDGWSAGVNKVKYLKKLLDISSSNSTTFHNFYSNVLVRKVFWMIFLLHMERRDPNLSSRQNNLYSLDYRSLNISGLLDHAYSFCTIHWITEA